MIPFFKGIVKKLMALKLTAFLKAMMILLWNISKLFLLKLFKTLGLRYGVFFSQHRWYWIRRSKVMFLRRGKQFFRATGRFWNDYRNRDKWIILIAFFPLGLILFMLGLSFNITRKTMVQKTRESAIFQVATSAGKTNRGARAWIARLDKLTLKKIRDLTTREQVAENRSDSIDS